MCAQKYNLSNNSASKDGLLKDHPDCAFAKILSNDPPTQYSPTPFGNFPTGSVLSYQAIEYDKPQVDRENPNSPLPVLPLSIIENAPCVFDIHTIRGGRRTAVKD